MGLEPDRAATGRPTGARVVVATLAVLALLVGGVLAVVLATGDDGPAAPGPADGRAGGTAAASTPSGTSGSSGPAVPDVSASTPPAVEVVPPSERAEERVRRALAAARHGDPIPRPLHPLVSEVKNDRAGPSLIGNCDYRKEIRALCAEGALNPDHTLVLLGNSHALHWVAAVNAMATRAGYRAYFLVKSQCSPVVAESVAKGGDVPWDDCNDFNAWARRQVARLRPDLVIISTTPPLRMMVDGAATGDDDVIESLMPAAFGDLIDLLAPHAGEVALLGDIPRRDAVASACLAAPDATLFGCTSGQVLRTKRIRRLTGRVAAEHGATYVDPEPWFCLKGRCPAVVGRTITMRDEGHMTESYAGQLTGALAQELGLTLVGPAKATG